jgi:sister chromatid cohesion protein DCC1
MATQQNEGGVPFAVAHDYQHFRLLELPPELVQLLEAPDAPPSVPAPRAHRRLNTTRY